MNRAWWLLGLVPVGIVAALYLHLSLSQQKLQMYADGAAMAAAQAVFEQKDPGGAVAAYVRKFSVPDLSRPPEYEAPPRSGRYDGNASAVRIHLRSTWRPPLVSRLLTLELDARATGAAWQGGPNPSQVAFVRIE